MKALNEEIWNGCVIMCRRALEEAMSHLGAEGADLFNKIDNLVFLDTHGSADVFKRRWFHITNWV